MTPRERKTPCCAGSKKRNPDAASGRSRAVRAIEPSAERNADSRRRPRFFAASPFFLGGGSYGFDFLGSAPALNRGSGRRLGFGFAGDQSPKRAFAGARKALFCLRRACQARGAGGPGAIGAHDACVAARRSAIIAPLRPRAFFGKVCKKR